MTTTTPAARFQKGPIPLYVQHADVLCERLARNHKVGDKIATVDELAREYGLAKVTVRQAQALLEQEGLISCRPGRGSGVIVLRDQEAPGRIRLAGAV